MKRRDRESDRDRGLVDEWWKAVLTGETEARHPKHGDDLRARFIHGRLVLSGEVPSKRDRDELLREARKRVGRGLHEYDASRLKIRATHERPGLLAQMLLAAYGHRDTADVALDFLMEHVRHKPLRAEVLDQNSKLAGVVPRELMEDAKRQIESGKTLLAIDVDETEAFGVRALLEEDTRSLWTVAAPPRLRNGAGS